MIPKMTKIEGGSDTVESAEFALSNFQTLGFLFENAAGAKLTVKVKANTEGGTAEFVPFLLRAVTETEYEEVDADGKEIDGAGTFFALITDRMLAHDERDRAALCLSVDTGDLATAYALQFKPRYSDNE